MNRLKSLHAITQDLPHRSHVEQATMACEAGARWVQLRAKGLEVADYAELAREVVAATRPFGAVVIVNDQPEVAALAGAHGVHLGKEDASPAEARRIVGAGRIIGVTVNGDDDLERIERITTGCDTTRVDYAGVGPFRATTTKPRHAPPIGLAGIARLIERARPLNLPMVAIGGITPRDCHGLIAAGTRGVAVASAINEAANPQAAVRSFLHALGSLEPIAMPLELERGAR
ncbi:MAG: thiamine phosphate synthase [Acidobacteria bacterium]|nr:thiamine phosphate synthase [Acidobacteriota bacterium]